MRVAVFGAKGLLGRAVSVEAGRRGGEVLALTHQACDVADFAEVTKALGRFRPELVLNASAYTDVDRAESEPDLCFRANAQGPAVLASAVKPLGARLVHVSTDYVFDGFKGAPYEEGDEPAPRGVYARAKLAGERIVLEALPGTGLVLRTAWVYGPGGKSFVSKIPDILKAKGEIDAIADQWSSPTRADELAGAMLDLVEAGASGLFHVAGTGAPSYHEIALEAARALGIDPAKVRPAASAKLPRPAPRPRFSALRSARLEAEGFPPLRPWAESFAEFALGG